VPVEPISYFNVSNSKFRDLNEIESILEKVSLHPERKEKELPEAVKILANEIKESVYAYPLSEHVPDLTSKDDIIQVKRYLAKYYKDFLF